MVSTLVRPRPVRHDTLLESRRHCFNPLTLVAGSFDYLASQLSDGVLVPGYDGEALFVDNASVAIPSGVARQANVRVVHFGPAVVRAVRR